MKQSGMRGSFAGVACAALLINALLPAAVCIGLFDVSRGSDCAIVFPLPRAPWSKAQVWRVPLCFPYRQTVDFYFCQHFALDCQSPVPRFS
jgi:hypothetical protein